MSVLEKMLSKRAKKVRLDIGDGQFYIYDDKEPYGKDDAEFVKALREPYGIGRSLAGGVLPALLSGTIMGGARYLGDKLETSGTDSLNKALLTGGAVSAATLPLFAYMLYGKRNSMPVVTSALQGLRKAREERDKKQAKTPIEWNSRDI